METGDTDDNEIEEEGSDERIKRRTGGCNPASAGSIGRSRMTSCDSYSFLLGAQDSHFCIKIME
jgi:hypothetical protein